MNSRTAYIIKVSLIVALGGFIMGFDASVISGVKGFIENDFNLNDWETGWAVSCMTLTAAIAMLFSGPLSDKFGRKKVLKSAAVLYAFSALSSALATNFEIFYIARMIGGFGVGVSLVIAPMYIAEISPPQMRGRMVSFNQLNIVLGLSAAFFSNYLILKLSSSGSEWVQTLGFDTNTWRWMLGIEALPALLYFVFLFVVPESPRWLIMKGQETTALSIMTKASGEDAAKRDLGEIKESMKSNTKKEKTPLSELFRPAMRFVLLIGVTIAILQQAVGINSVFFYSTTIFEQTGIGKDASFIQAIFIGLTNVVFTIVAMKLIDRIGRKPLLLIGVSGIAISMFVISASFNSATFNLKKDHISQIIESEQNIENKKDLEKLFVLEGKTFESDLELRNELNNTLGDEKAKNYADALIRSSINVNSILVLLGIIFFIASFAISLGPVMWVLFSELFPNKLRGLAISFAGTVNSAVSFLVQLVFPWELTNFGNAGTFLIYGIVSVLGLVFIASLIPETKGKSLEELEKILVKSKSRKAIESEEKVLVETE